MEVLLIIIGIIGVIAFIGWLNNRLSDLREKAVKYVQLKPKLDNLDTYSRELDAKKAEHQKKEVEWEKKVQSDTKAVETLVKEKSEGFPWLAKAYAEYLYLQDLKRADYLEHKRPPALKAAEHLREVASHREIAEERYRVLKYQLESYKQEIGLVEVERKQSELDYLAKRLAVDRQAIDKLAQEKSLGSPWLAQAYDDYFQLQDLKMADYLENKSPPALKAAEVQRQIAKERRDAERAARLADYLLDYCRYLAPWLDDYIGLEVEELDEIIKEIHSSWEKKEREFDEEVKRHYGPKYYEGLTPTEKLQKKLDWYWGKPNKTNWQIGRDYERYIGYLYEKKDWSVYYHGKKGYEDLGRDLICKKDNTVEIVQCKYWAREKIIHEKHIYYLFGTTVEYYLENFGGEGDLQLALFPGLVRKRNVIPKLVTTIEVSPKAEQVAKVLGVVVEKIPFEHYPSVKCNVARRTGEKIFHLPFDQQYDTTLIEEERLECYVETITEAEALGFRHAYRWMGEKEVVTNAKG